jgi:8-oxo-dGTP diphosphatase
MIDAQVQAGGGIIIRSGKKGPKVLLVHRARRNDWSFPKGKLDPGETFKEAARREVEEETGFLCTVHGSRFASVNYMIGNGRGKEVRYWLMTVDSGEFVPNDEVDMITWVRLKNAAECLTYSRDRRILRYLIDSGRVETILS